MQKRSIYRILILISIGIAILAWLLLGPVGPSERSRNSLYIPTGHSDRQTVMDSIEVNSLVRNPRLFSWIAEMSGVWDKIKPGRYIIYPGTNLVEIIRMLRNGSQTPINLIINKFRTKEDFSRSIGRVLECDSASMMTYLKNNDSLALFSVDTNTVMTLIIPNTYALIWNTSPKRILKRMASEKDVFWNKERLKKASDLNLKPDQVYTLASIVEEESNKHDEQPQIASVYLNRLKKKMPLSADPTVKYALRDFGLKRIYLKHIDESASSPYNTYRHEGLPPGPICTPAIKTIDAVLNARQTDFLFFCAKPDFSGYHDFSTTAAHHFHFAKAYLHALDSLHLK